MGWEHLQRSMDGTYTLAYKQWDKPKKSDVSPMPLTACFAMIAALQYLSVTAFPKLVYLIIKRSK